MEQILAEISEALQKGRASLLCTLITRALEQGLPAQRILDDGLLAGMRVLGVKFRSNDIFVPEVLVAARAMNVGVDMLKPHLQADGVQARGRVCLGTVRGDLHDIGKNLVRTMMEGRGLQVFDLGVDVDAETFVHAAVEHDCQIIACSALLTTTIPAIGEVVRAVEQAGIRSKVRILIGGAPVTEAFCRTVRADAYTPDAAAAADEAVRLLAELEQTDGPCRG
jgi:methanogenic corrinoid protein MtbC1